MAWERSAARPGDKLLIGGDNNLPKTRRNPTIADDTEPVVVSVPDLDDQG
jgi:hypothetical protein